MWRYTETVLGTWEGKDEDMDQEFWWETARILAAEHTAFAHGSGKSTCGELFAHLDCEPPPLCTGKSQRMCTMHFVNGDGEG